jgi:hypothetical protein
MAILFSSNANISTGSFVGSASDKFSNLISDGFGVSGYPQPDTSNSNALISGLEKVRQATNSVVNKLLGSTGETYERSYMGSGRQTIVEGGHVQSQAVAAEDASIRQVYTQNAKFSVVIKKKMVSGLGNLYDATLMDKAEKWVFRAMKELVRAKCSAMAEYERMTKIDRMMDSGANPTTIISSLIASAIDSDVDYSGISIDQFARKATFNSARELQKLMMANSAPDYSTYYVDPSVPSYPELGQGSGAFELTAIGSIDTSLDLDGNGSCSFSIEDPYRLLVTTAEDIELAVNATAETNLSNPLTSRKLLQGLEAAQAADITLSKSRSDNNKSQITFTVNIGSGNDVTATIDALGLELTGDNFDDVPSEQSLSQSEISDFFLVKSGLGLYAQSVKQNYLRGTRFVGNAFDRKNRSYVLKTLRQHFLGKSIVQPMDSIHVYISGGTRRMGEGEDLSVLEDGDVTTWDGAIKTASSILSSYDGSGNLAYGPDEGLLKQEYERFKSYGKYFLSFDDFRKLRATQIGDEHYIHVFGGVVSSVTDSFQASNGKFILSVSANSNIEWLKLSRYNTQPSLDQTQGFVYDPFTPFQFDTDPASGLPIGNPKLLPENEEVLFGTVQDGISCRKVFFDNGPLRGKQVTSLEDLEVDVKKLGGNIKRLFYHAPGLKYRWKSGIITAIYDMSTIDPKNGSTVSFKELTRDVGLFTSNRPFDNMDAANVLSTMITGQPYNYATFVQSAINNGTFSIDTSLNGQRNYFNSLLDIQNNFVQTHGNFQPFKSFTVSPNDLARAIVLQQRLTGVSSEIKQLRSEYVRISDQIGNMKAIDSSETNVLIDKLKTKRLEISKKIENLIDNFSDLTKASGSSKVINVAGDDISFDFNQNLGDKKEAKLFGDKLYFSTLRQRSDVVYNRDSNYLIISDEYDKDYDIQAFVLELSKQLGTLWKSTWQDVYSLCKEVAGILNFELFVNTQGHIEFRPPQYNRVPASVLAAMLTFNNDKGIFPEFVSKLFKSREDSLIDDIILTEWKIAKEAALLGYTSIVDVQKFIFGNIGNTEIFLIGTSGLNLQDSIASNEAISPEERLRLKDLVGASNSFVQSRSNAKGLFSAKAQYNNFKRIALDDNGEVNEISSSDHNSRQEFYELAVDRIVNLTGQQKRTIPTYDQARVGAKRNGVSSPATDVSNYISKIAQLVSQRSRLLNTLGKVVNQNIEINEVSENANSNLKKMSFSRLINMFGGENSEIYNRLIIDDSRDILGHLSRNRFIIRDEHIISSSYSENPPQYTSVVVDGKEPLIGEGSGNIAGVPIHRAYGVDFDMWRQYGWRAESEFEKPFFWSADKQCAPYALMLLARQRKNIVTGEITVIGNEYYQLGDVVYVSERQMLYYVHKVSHKVSLDGQFVTSLSLKYGHSVGEYIPTPFDVMGKLSAARSGVQNSYRVRRERSNRNFLLGVIKFPNGLFGGDTKKDMLTGEYGANNFNILKNASLLASRELDPTNPKFSPRIYLMTYTKSASERALQKSSVRSWFVNPEGPGEEPGGGIGLVSFKKSSNGLESFKLPDKLIFSEHVRLCLPPGENFTATENELLTKFSMTASQESLTKDPTLDSVVEIRLVRPPENGWDE